MVERTELSMSGSRNPFEASFRERNPSGLVRSQDVDINTLADRLKAEATALKSGFLARL
jgi:hypothetical protein